MACSYLCEGHILLIVDNLPAVLLLPGTIFQFTQSPEDYYNNPLTGTYFRMIRFLCIPVSLLLLPVFLLLSAYYPRDYCLAAAHTRQRSVTLPFFFLCAGGGVPAGSFQIFSGTQLQPRLRCSVHCRRTINR